MVIRKIGVGSAAKLAGTLYAVWGFIFGAIFALLALAGASLGGDEDVPAWIGGFVGAGAVIFLPILYGAMGAIFGALTAVFYNVVSGMVGGLSVEVD
jgi:hypothetical protein